ncbi:MAG: ModE family transcriptional regulator [Proteobacteria bacterium]|nr:MAG: ModE family transcriptional regulator [Pseudomonadota bacterium]
MARVKLRVYFPGDHSLGPGKVALLEAVREHGSISAAARALGMAYRHAWVLIDDLNRCFATPVVSTATGGSAGGGTTLTPLGEELVRRYHRMQQRAERALAGEIAALEAKRRPARRTRAQDRA